MVAEGRLELDDDEYKDCFGRSVNCLKEGGMTYLDETLKASL